MTIPRREFIKKTGLGAAVLLTSARRASAAVAGEAPAQARDPRWRGFNLTELQAPSRPPRSFQESDFEFMARWGFNFARIPMSYWAWSRPDPVHWLALDEKAFEIVDRVIAFGRRYGVHINLNLHRIPGYCINLSELEPMQLFKGPAENQARALNAACHHWRFIAARYRGIPSSELSFDLLNEPPVMEVAGYVRVVKVLVASIREADPDRLIVADGINVGRTPVPELAELNLMQSTRGYDPMAVSHYQATWIPHDDTMPWAVPIWPLTLRNGEVWNRERLRQQLIEPWQAVEAQGVKVHVGEWGCYSHTPHAVALAWMQDLLELWREAGWGWALWNLRGSFGVLDSGRADVRYEPYGKFKLDRPMLDLLVSH